MDSLISRQAAIDAFEDTTFTKNEVRRRLSELPPEQPEIIYCKDCKYVGTDATCCLVCDRDGMGLKPYHVRKDDFCSKAERRTNGV